MILDTNAVVNPLAVMVESLDALVADVAMTGVGRAEDLAVRAEQVGFKMLNEAHEWNLGSALHIAWLHPDC